MYQRVPNCVQLCFNCVPLCFMVFHYFTFCIISITILIITTVAITIAITTNGMLAIVINAITIFILPSTLHASRCLSRLRGVKRHKTGGAKGYLITLQPTLQSLSKLCTRKPRVRGAPRHQSNNNTVRTRTDRNITHEVAREYEPHTKQSTHA